MVAVVALAGGMLLAAGGTAQASADTVGRTQVSVSAQLAIDFYEIRARHSDKCLDVANANVAHAANVVQGTCWGGANQHWRLVNLGNGYYEIRPQHAGDKCLDVANASAAHAANVVQGTCWGGTNQHWRLVNLGNGFYEIRARHSNKCLDVAHASQAHAANVIQGNCSNLTNQHWRFVYAGTWS